MKEVVPAVAIGKFGGRDAAVMIILNRRISSFRVLETIWSNSLYHVCADGGANRLHDIFYKELEPRRKDFLPNAIIGDLDSLRADVVEYYDEKSVQIIVDADQYSTDLGKSIKHLMEFLKQAPRTKDIIIMGSLSGRVDQGLGILHELYREGKLHSEHRFWLVSESSVSFLLQPGENRILHLRKKSVNDVPLFTPNVGILPLFGPAVISTQGLEWDVSDWETEMGKNVSTSNHVCNDLVAVWTDRWVLFTVEIFGEEDESP